MQIEVSHLTGLSDETLMQLVKARGILAQFGPRHQVIADHYRNGQFLARHITHNDITNEGKNLIFDTFFNSATQITTWYTGLISNSGYSALAATDVMNSHAGWTEFTSYSQSTRVTWTSGASSGQSVTNSSPMTFDITGSGTVKGVFITSNSTKSGTTGKLWATALFAADVPVSNGDQLKVTYTVSA